MSNKNKSVAKSSEKQANVAEPIASLTPVEIIKGRLYAANVASLPANLILLAEKFTEKFAVKPFVWQEADKLAFDTLAKLGLMAQAEQIEQAARAAFEKANPTPTPETVRPWFDKEIYLLALETGLRRAYSKSADADATLSVKAEEELRTICKNGQKWDADALGALYKVSPDKIREFMKAQAK